MSSSLARTLDQGLKLRQAMHRTQHAPLSLRGTVKQDIDHVGGRASQLHYAVVWHSGRWVSCGTYMCMEAYAS